MKLGILIGHIKSEVEKNKKLAIEPLTSQGDNYYFHLEAQKTLQELDAVIKQLETFNPEQEATLDHVKIITDFFEKRWERIKGTDVIYNIHTESSLNQLCVYIARYLADQRDLVMKRNFMALLMPTIKSWHNDVSHEDLWTRYLHNYLPTDDNEWLIQMGYVDLNMDERNEKLVMSIQVGGYRKYLSEAEAGRVYHHSQLIADLYDLMKAHQQESIKVGQAQQEAMKKAQSFQDAARRAQEQHEANKRAQVQQDALRKGQEPIQRARDNMVKALRDEGYGKRTVQSTYGKAGVLLLKENLLKERNDLFITREQLFDFMAANVPPGEWKKFLAGMDDDGKFLKLILRGATVEEVLKQNTLFKKNDTYDRAVAFCLTDAYWRQRDAGPEFTSYSGRLFGWPKDIKEKVVEIMRKYLAGVVENGSDYSKYFVTAGGSSLTQPVLSAEEQTLLDAMREGTVGKIHMRVCELITPPVSNAEVNAKLGMAAVLK